MKTNIQIENELKRDRFNLSTQQMLDDYSYISSRRKNAVESTSLRIESRDYLRILAHQASAGSVSYEELLKLAQADETTQIPSSVDAQLLGSIGRVLVLRNFDSTDQNNGIKLLQEAILRLPRNIKSRKYRKLEIEYYINLNNFRKANELLDRSPDLDREYHNYLRVDIQNPYINNGKDMGPNWLRNFNLPLTSKGLVPVQIDPWNKTPFDGLSSSKIRTQEMSTNEGPLVTVVLTTYNPQTDQILSAIKSILNQTYRNLELILVDDCSSDFPKQEIDLLVSCDQRLRVINTEVNSGTYVARNIGFSAAKGEFITGHDDDDWSHPQRIDEQVKALTNNPSLPGCKVKAITCSPRLMRSRIGYTPEVSNASSLMIRKNDFEILGGFIPMRKAADTELQRRLEKISGQTVLEINLPLTFIRILSDSLSRSEFRPGWSHSARRQFKSSYNHWHTFGKPSALKQISLQKPMVKIPRRFLIQRSDPLNSLQVVFAGDWSRFGGPQKSMIEEIRALAAAGYRLGVLHLEAPRFMSTAPNPMCEAIQELINSDLVEEVLYDDDVEIELLILRYPPILQFAPDYATNLKIENMIVLANQAPSELDGSDIRYLVPDCNLNAREYFCSNVLWVPQGPQVRDAIAPYLSKIELANFDMPGILDISEWKIEKNSFMSSIPVVGRHSRDNPMKWPEDAETIKSAYPLDGSLDVRILGGGKTPQRVLNYSETPQGWTVYQPDEIPAQLFLKTIDFYVFFQHTLAIEAFGRAILEALATGLVVILPRHYEPVFGDAAVYAEPEQIQSIIRKFQNNRELYEQQRSTSLKIVEDRFSHSSYQKLIKSILENGNE